MFYLIVIIIDVILVQIYEPNIAHIYAELPYMHYAVVELYVTCMHFKPCFSLMPFLNII